MFYGGYAGTNEMEKIREWSYKYSVELMTGIFLLYSIYINRADNIYSYVKAWYVIDYSYGFGSRLLIGSILHLFCGEVVTDAAAYCFVVASLCLLCIALALFAGYIYRGGAGERSQESNPLFNCILYSISCVAGVPVDC